MQLVEEEVSGTEEALGGALLDDTIRVRLDRAQHLLDTIGELVIAQATYWEDGLLWGPASLRLRAKVTNASKIARGLYDAAIRLRMVRLDSALADVLRESREAVRGSGKAIEVEVDGGDSEIDRDSAEMLVDPLVRLANIAIAFGIEDEATRRAAGKPPTGRIRIVAKRTGSTTRVSLEHDGRPIDTDALRLRATKRGLLEPGAAPSREALLALAFSPGITARDRTGEVGGCGPGLDVARKTVEALGGSIAVTSEPQLTRYTIETPLTSAMTDGLLVRVCGHRYLVPLANVSLAFRPRPGDVRAVAEKGEFVAHRGELLPVVRLASLVAGGKPGRDFDTGVIVVVSAGERRFAVLVDELIGQHQVVAKSLGPMPAAPIVAGGALMSDGRVGLILDPHGLMIDVVGSSPTWINALRILTTAAGKYLRAGARSVPASLHEGADGLGARITLLSVATHVEVRVSLALRTDHAKALANSLFGCNDDDVAQEVVSELANIFMGGLKTSFSKDVLPFTGGLPELCSVDRLTVANASDRYQQVGGIEVGGGTLWVHVAMRSRARRAVLPTALTEGMVLALDVLDARGAPLFDRGVRLSLNMIDTVRQRASPTRAIEVILP